MDLSALARILIFAGIAVVILGVVVLLVGKVPGLGRLPGDIFIERGGTKIFIPIVTMLLVSLILTILLNVILRLFR